MFKRVAIFLVLGCLLHSAHSRDRELDYQALKDRKYSSVVATAGRSEFYFEDGVLSKFPVGSIFSMVGERESLKKGDEIAEHFGIADPAIDIAQRLSDSLAERLGVESVFMTSDDVPKPKMVWSMRDPQAIATKFGSGKLVVDVRSTSWAVNLLGNDRYRVGYWANAQIVDSSTGKALASKDCVQRPKKRSDAPLVATMFENEAAELKAEIQTMSNVCLDMFMTDLLGLATTE